VRLVLADDSTLFRTGLERLLRELGIDVVGSVANASELLTAVDKILPDIVVTDIRMPPTFTDEGLQAAAALRRIHPELGILLLSTYAESSSAARLLEIGRDRVGYLLKDRVDDPQALRDAMNRLYAGESVIDPELVQDLVAARRVNAEMAALTNRERQILQLMAEGRSNVGISTQMHLSPKTVETHVSSVFAKLGLLAETLHNRRVLAVLTFLRSGTPT
jgi:DNA-binding NarL/FixJ family response regulator